MDSATRLIDEARRLKIVGHIYADGDAVGSVIGLAEAAALQVKDVEGTFSPIPVAKEFRHLETRYLAPPDQMEITSEDVVVCVDTATPDRLPKPIQPQLGNAAAVIVIDHHDTGTPYGTHQIIDKGASSAAEVVTRMIQGLGWLIPPFAAQALYGGVLADSGQFSYSSVTQQTLRTAADLIECGADPTLAAEELFDMMEYGTLKLKSVVLDRLGYDEDRKLVWSWASDSDLKPLGIGWDDTHPYLIDTIRTVRGSDVAVLFRTTRGQTKFSLRSRGPIDVSRIALAFGGGGHRNAAAARVSADVTMRDLLPQIREMVDMQRRNQ